ncbi:hypothetical protein HY386_01865 [Candidatus Daviesbacteria bacterium]|nr:hypothetical protein [Candidatus Daviesbacteria bacterium]
MRVTWILAILALSAIFLSGCNTVFAASNAQEDLTSGLTLDEAGAVEIGESLIYPSSPLYFLKGIRERIELMLSSNNKAKAQRELEFAQRRLREVRALIKHQRQDLIDSTLERYKASLNEARSLSAPDSSLQLPVGEAISRHLDVLQRVHDQVGNPRAKQAIRAALERGMEHLQTMQKRLDLVQQQELIRKTALRQALACNLLAREASNSGLTDTDRVYLTQKVKDCQQNIRENLKDELMELRDMKKQLRPATQSAK